MTRTQCGECGAWTPNVGSTVGYPLCDACAAAESIGDGAPLLLGRMAEHARGAVAAAGSALRVPEMGAGGAEWFLDIRHPDEVETVASAEDVALCEGAEEELWALPGACCPRFGLFPDGEESSHSSTSTDSEEKRSEGVREE